jgi:hypothetical protein
VILITPTVREQFALTLEFLSRRGLRPIVVLLDAETFGGAPGSTKLAYMVKAMGVPVRKVANGQDIREALIKQV